MERGRKKERKREGKDKERERPPVAASGLSSSPKGCGGLGAPPSYERGQHRGYRERGGGREVDGGKDGWEAVKGLSRPPNDKNQPIASMGNRGNPPMFRTHGSYGVDICHPGASASLRWPPSRLPLVNFSSAPSLFISLCVVLSRRRVDPQRLQGPSEGLRGPSVATVGLIFLPSLLSLSLFSSSVLPLPCFHFLVSLGLVHGCTDLYHRPAATGSGFKSANLGSQYLLLYPYKYHAGIFSMWNGLWYQHLVCPHNNYRFAIDMIDYAGW